MQQAHAQWLFQLLETLHCAQKMFLAVRVILWIQVSVGVKQTSFLA